MNTRMSKVMLAAVLVVSVNATAASVTMKDLASGAVVGQVELSESPYGAVFTPVLSFFACWFAWIPCARKRELRQQY